MILKSGYSSITGKSVSLNISIDRDEANVTYVVTDDLHGYRKREFESFADAVGTYDAVVEMIEKKEKEAKA